MAKRLETQYVNICLQLPGKNLFRLKEVLQHYGMRSYVKILSNGQHQIKVNDPVSQESFVLMLEREASGKWVNHACCRMSNSRLADTIRKIIFQFQGDAISRRIYSGFTVVYFYAQGKVAKILEIKDDHSQIIYENRERQLQHLFEKQDVERQIRHVYRTIDLLLDQRLQTVDVEQKNEIDQLLQRALAQLFYLEA